MEMVILRMEKQRALLAVRVKTFGPCESAFQSRVTLAVLMTDLLDCREPLKQYPPVLKGDEWMSEEKEVMM